MVVTISILDTPPLCGGTLPQDRRSVSSQLAALVASRVQPRCWTRSKHSRPGCQQCVYSRAKECALFNVLAHDIVSRTRCMGGVPMGCRQEHLRLLLATTVTSGSEIRVASLDEIIGWILC